MLGVAQSHLKSGGLPFGNFQERGFPPDEAVARANLIDQRWGEGTPGKDIL
jgi:hypothetical protein